MTWELAWQVFVALLWFLGGWIVIGLVSRFVRSVARIADALAKIADVLDRGTTGRRL